MSKQIPIQNLSEPLKQLLDETFTKVHGIFLDKGTTLFDTLDNVTAEEASQSISSNSATIAAQVEHLRFYLDVLNSYIREKEIAKVNWREIWETVREVTPSEWEAIKTRLRTSHTEVLNTINSFENWDSEYEIGGALSILTHTAYHLGGIRVTLGAIRGQRNK